MPEPRERVYSEFEGGTVYLRMSMRAGVELRRLIVAYLSLPEAPLLPPEQEDILLAIYDALCDVTEPALTRWYAPPSGQTGQAEGGQGPAQPGSEATDP